MSSPVVELQEIVVRDPIVSCKSLGKPHTGIDGGTKTYFFNSPGYVTRHTKLHNQRLKFTRF